MKILLVTPPYRTTDHLTSWLYPMPYGPLLIAAVLREAGHEVALKDFLVPAQKHKTPQPRSFDGYRKPAYMHFGVPLEECKAWLKENARAYDAVGLAMCQCNIFETAGALGRYIHNVLDMPMVIGGPFASTATDRAVEESNADVVVVGEGEGVCVEAFERAVAGEHGVVLNGEQVDVTALPLPAWDLSPPSLYPKVQGKVRGTLTVSRGCPWTCDFCSVWTMMSRNHRRLDAAGIERELRHLHSFGVRYFSFLDDNLLISEKKANELFEVIDKLRAEGPEWKRCKFYIEEGIEVRVAAVPGLLKRAAESGFDNLAIGLETMNAAQRKRARKPFNEEMLVAALKECDGAGVSARAFYIIGFPGETVDSVTADLIEFGKIGLAARPNNLKVYPGTDVSAWFQREGWITADYDWRMSSFHTPNSGGLTMSQIQKLKTVLGAIGRVAEEYKIRAFLDTPQEIGDKLAPRYELTKHPHGGYALIGKFWRATTLRHLLALLVLRDGAPGANMGQADGYLWATPALQPKDEIQAAIAKHLGTDVSEQTSLAM